MGQFINESRNHIASFSIDLRSQTVTVLLRDVHLATISHKVTLTKDNDTFTYNTEFSGMESAVVKAKEYVAKHEDDYRWHIEALITGAFLIGE